MITCANIIAHSGASFGTSGVRGLVEDLDDESCFAFTVAFLSQLIEEKALKNDAKVWVGHDLRPSSPAIAVAVLSAIDHLGLTPVFCGEIATPALAFSSIAAKEPAVMITGSHIPFDRNGIKFYRSDGEMTKADEALVLNSTKDFPEQLFNNKKLRPQAIQIPTIRMAHDAWLHRYKSAFEGVLEGMRVGHYQHSAAGRDDLSNLLQALGANVIPLMRSETFVPIDTEAVSESDRDQAKSWTKEYNLDALVSTDGDGDRPLLADENGNYLRGDTLGIFTAMALKANAVVTPVSSNTALEKCKLFSTIGRTKIGSPHVIAKMEEFSSNKEHSIVGFEANGGFLTASELKSPWNNNTLGPLPTRDSVLPVLATIALAKIKDIKISELASLLPQRITASDRLVETPKEKSLALLAKFESSEANPSDLTITNVPLEFTDTTDGMRFTFQDETIVHLRPSGNAPELRIYVETEAQSSADALLTNAVQATTALLD